MRILEVILDGMGCFRRDSGAFDFDGDRVVVLGPNEAGKSTLMRSIDALLFGFENAGEESRWRPWGTHQGFGGRIAFEVKRRRFGLDREFDKNYVRLSQDSTVIFEGEANPRGKSGEPFHEVLSTILPLTRSRFFQSLSFVRQEEMQTSMSDDLRERITGGHRLDALKVRANLEAMFAELTWEKPPWGNPLRKKRMVEELQDQLKDKRERRNRAVEITRRGSQVLSELQTLEARINVIENGIGTSESVLGKQEEFLRLLEKESRFREKLIRLNEELRRVEALTGSTQSLRDAIHSEFSDFASMPPDTTELLHELKTKSSQEEEIKEQISVRENVIEEETEKPIVGWHHYAIPLAAGVLIGLIGGLVAGKVILAAIVGAVIGLLAAALWTQKIRSERTRQFGALTQELAILRSQYAKLSEGLTPLLTQLKPILRDSSLEEASQRWKSYQKLSTELMKAQAGLSNNRPLDTIRVEHHDVQIEYGHVADRIDQVVEKNSYLGIFRKEPEKLGFEVEREKENIRSLDSELSVVKRKRDDLKVEWRGQVEAGVDDVDDLEAEIQALEKCLVDQIRKKAALILAWECLTEAMDDIRDEHQGIIQQRTDELFRAWTGGADRSVILEKDWNPWIVTPDNPRVAPELLSRGTLDQLYLAFRVALSEALSQDVPLPFLLDDPFVHFDPQRRKLAWEAFEAISERHQVILFTQDPDFRDWGKLVEL